MSEKYPGGVIRSTPVTPAGPYQDSAASGIWTLDQATNFIKQGNWPTAGNVNPSAFIENLFSTWLYTGNGSTQTITNGIDLSTYGGLLWIKNRNILTYNHILSDTTQPVNKFLYSNSTSALDTDSSYITARGTSGFTVGSGNPTNYSGLNFVSWTFRKQPKFFDVVTWTGTGGSVNQTVSHNLGATPGAIFVKRTSGTANWFVYHRSVGAGAFLYLNTSDPSISSTGGFGGVSPTSTQFTVGGGVNDTVGATYVAYLFAHDAGGFGLTGTDNVISCGSFTGGSPATVNLGYEPQWLLIKSATNADNWYIFDTMRGWTVNYSGLNYLIADSSGAENTGGTTSGLTNTGFNFNYGSGQTFIYIAIRRGPMKTPTSGTSVFSPVARVGTGATANVTAGFAPDTAISAYRTAGEYMPLVDKLRGPTNWLTWQQSMTNAESTGYSGEWFTAFTNTGVTVGADNSGGKSVNSSGGSLIQYYFQRAPGFFDTVCYTGTGVNGAAVPHNLTVAPEFIIAKRRASTSVWLVYQSSLGTGQYLLLSSNVTPSADVNMWGNTTPTSSNFYVGSSTNFSGFAYVSYLFATCPGVSKVGSFTGTNAVQTINCGFTSSARFVLIKRTDSAGDWYIWDSARGITSGNDPYLLINATAAEVTGTNYVDAAATGFVLNGSGSPVNSNGASYIFLAIA